MAPTLNSSYFAVDMFGKKNPAGIYNYKVNPNGSIGVDYFFGGKPVTREGFRMFTGANIGDIERAGLGLRQASPAHPSAASASAASASAASKYTPPPWIPSINLNDVYNQARNNATNAANALFQTKVNDLVARMNAKRNRAREDYTTNVAELNTKLEKTMQDIATNKERTIADTTKNVQDIGTEERARQVTEARQYDASRRGLQSQLGEAGLSTSGLGRQQLEEAKLNRRDVEQAQAKKVSNSIYAQNTTRDRTLSDLVSSGDWAKKTTETGIKAEGTSRDRAIEDVMWEETTNRWDFEKERLAAIESGTAAGRKNYWANYLGGLSNPQKEYANKIYSGVF